MPKTSWRIAAVRFPKTAPSCLSSGFCPKEMLPSAGKFADVVMMLMTGGKERTVEEYRHLLGRAGFSLNQVIPTSSDLHIIEALPH